MIFKQVDEILSGRKTQTRRVCKPFEEAVIWPGPDNDYAPIGYADEVAIVTPIWGTTGSVTRTKWVIGRTYAVVPKRGQPAVWWMVVDGIPIWNHAIRYEPFYQPGEPTDWENGHYVDLRHELEYQGFQPLRIRITAIRQENVQDITEVDARAEGVGSVEEYRQLWDGINGKTKGARWDDNPLVFVLTFEVAKDN